MKRLPNCNCKVCNKAIYRRPVQLAGAVYCSRACYGLGQRREVRFCACGKQLTPKQRFTCSQACTNKRRLGTKYNKGVKIKALAVLVRELRGAKCEDCGYDTVPGILEIHHVVRKADGGSDAIENLVLLCPNCHAIRHYNTGRVGERLKPAV